MLTLDKYMHMDIDVDLVMVHTLHVTYHPMQEIQLEDLQIAVCAIECFLTTKVASLDPDFIAQTDLVSQ